MTLSDSKFNELPTKICELWWQKRNLMKTTTGYGKKIETIYKVFKNNKWYRVYTDIISNNNPVYIIVNKKCEYLN